MNPQMMKQFRQFMANPSQALSQMGIPANMQSSPQGIIQYLMNSGKLSQDQYNQLQAQARQIQSMLK